MSDRTRAPGEEPFGDAASAVDAPAPDAATATDDPVPAVAAPAADPAPVAAASAADPAPVAAASVAAAPAAGAPAPRRARPARRPRPAAPSPGYTRRQVLYTAAAAGATVAAGALLIDRDDGLERRSYARIRDHRVDRPKGGVDLAVARGPDPAVNTRRAIAALGGMSAFVRRGESVAIKPNVGWNRSPDQAANTNPEVVAEIVRQAVAAGASKVWVTDVPVNTAERCFARSGIGEAARAAGAQVVVPTDSSFRPVEVAGIRLRLAEVLGPLVDADRVINVPVAKQHGLTRATLGMKNWYGVLGGHRVLLHQDIHRYITDLAVMMRPTLTVLDATRILTANGPSGGSLADVRRLDTVAASADPVAIDAFGAGLLGLAPADVGYIVMGEHAGLGTADLARIRTEEIDG
jgi:uncharacterized protein (DUF362 family)